MPYLTVELDAKKKMHLVARAVGISPGEVLWGLLELWEHVWSTENDFVSERTLIGCVGKHADLVPALVEFGFLEKLENNYRTKGADRYLRVTEAKRKAGQKRASAPRDGAGRLLATSPADIQQPASSQPARAGHHESDSPVVSAGCAVDDIQLSSSSRPAASQQPASSQPALTPSTEHRSKELLKEEEAPPALVSRPAPKVAPKKPDDPLASAEAFFAFAQHERLEAGLALEPVPRNLSAWWSNALMETNGDAERVLEALKRFAQDPYWRKATPPLPFPAFMKQLPSYLPPVEVRSA